MPPQPAAVQLKEFLIEWVLQTTPDGLFVDDVSPANFSRMAKLEPNGICSSNGGPVYSGPDLACALSNGIDEFKSEASLKFLMEQCAKDQATVKEAKALLDVELQVAGRETLMGSNINLTTKGRGVARYRIQKDLARLKQPQSQDSRNSEFRVVLTTLVGGHGGSPQKTTLYFSFGGSFHHFIRALQDATQLCTIPPREVTENYPGPIPKVWSPNSSRLPRRGDNSSIHNPASVSSALSEAELAYQSSSNSLPIASVHNTRSVRGYTLEDGPWVYRIGAKKQVQKGQYIDITDEASYLKLVDVLKEVKKNSPDEEYFAILIHSMDKKAKDKWDLKIKQEEREEREFIESCEGMDSFGDGDENRSGEPYLLGSLRNLQ